MNSPCQSRASHPPRMVAEGTRLRQGLSRMWGTWSPRPIVLALKGFTPRTGSVGFAGPRTTRGILATPLVFKLPIAGVPLPDLSFSVSIPRSIVQPLARISANSAVHPCQMILSIGTWFAQRPSGMQVSPDVLHIGPSLVLSALRLSPYELIREVSLKYLTPSPLAENLLRCLPWVVCPRDGIWARWICLPLRWHMSQMDLYPTASFPSSSLQGTLPLSSMPSPSPPLFALTTKSVPLPRPGLDVLLEADQRSSRVPSPPPLLLGCRLRAGHQTVQLVSAASATACSCQCEIEPRPAGDSAQALWGLCMEFLHGLLPFLEPPGHFGGCLLAVSRDLYPVYLRDVPRLELDRTFGVASAVVIQ